MKIDIKSCFIILILMPLLNSCQFSSTFHRAKKLENTSFHKLENYTLNENFFRVTHESLNSDINIFKDTVKLYKAINIKPLDFKSKSGNNLSGLLLTPKNNIREDLLFLHFHGSGANVLQYHFPLMTKFAEKGYQVYTFDYSGYGFSEGKATRKIVLTDAYSALEFIKNNPDFKDKKIIILGQSYGGYLASVVGSNRQNDIEGIVIEGAFYSHRKEAVYTAGFAANIVYDGVRADREIKKNKKPILIIHSNEDDIVPIKFGRKIFDEANEPKYFMEIDKRHLGGLLYYGDNIINKINKVF